MDFEHNLQQYRQTENIVERQGSNIQKEPLISHQPAGELRNQQKLLKKKTKNKNRLNHGSKQRRRIKSESWNYLQIKKIFKLYQQYGSQWKIMETQFADRVANSIKNRFYTVIRTLLKILFKWHPLIKQKLPHEIPSKLILKFYQGRDEFSKFKGFGKKVLRTINYNLQSEQIKKIVSQNQADILSLYELMFDFKVEDNMIGISRKQEINKSKSEGYCQKLYTLQDICQKIKTPKSTPVDLHKARTQPNESAMNQELINNSGIQNQGIIYFIPITNVFQMPAMYPMYQYY